MQYATFINYLFVGYFAGIHASVASKAEEAEYSRTPDFTSGFNGLMEFDHGVVFAIMTVQ